MRASSSTIRAWVTLQRSCNAREISAAMSTFDNRREAN
jgi:hypothetical protein